MSPRYEGRGGHPVGLGRGLLDMVRGVSDPGTERLDHLVRTLDPKAIARPEVPDAKVLLNLNTPDQFRVYGNGFLTT